MNYLLINDRSAAPLDLSKNSQRTISVDIFRGFSITFMILINTQAYFPKIYSMFRESYWDGLSFADCIFPAFLFIMGFSIILSHKDSKFTTIKKSIKRLIILTVVGFLLNLIDILFDFKNVRIPSVLLRIAILHTICTLCYLIHFYFLIVITICLITLYSMLTYLYEVPFCGEGVLTPFCFAGGYFDTKIFTRNHMIFPTDPEGFLSSCTAFYSVFSGLTCAWIHRRLVLGNSGSRLDSNYVNRKKWKIVIYWIIFSFLNLLISLSLYFFLDVQFNKKIYSLSFTFMETSICGFVLIILFIIFDIFSFRKLKMVFSTFVWMSYNSLLIYILHILLLIGLDKIQIDNYSLIYWCGRGIFRIIDNKKMAYLIVGVIHLVIWKVFASILNCKKLFLRI